MLQCGRRRDHSLRSMRVLSRRRLLKLRACLPPVVRSREPMASRCPPQRWPGPRGRCGTFWQTCASSVRYARPILWLRGGPACTWSTNTRLTNGWSSIRSAGACKEASDLRSRCSLPSPPSYPQPRRLPWAATPTCLRTMGSCWITLGTMPGWFVLFPPDWLPEPTPTRPSHYLICWTRWRWNRW